MLTVSQHELATASLTQIEINRTACLFADALGEWQSLTVPRGLGSGWLHRLGTLLRSTAVQGSAPTRTLHGMPGSRKCNYVQDYDNAKANSQCQQIIIIIVIIGSGSDTDDE